MDLAGVEKEFHMIVSIKLQKMYHQFLDDMIQIENGVIQLKMNDGSTIGDVLKVLNIPEEPAKILLVNSKVYPPDQILQDQDHIFVFPPIAGG